MIEADPNGPGQYRPFTLIAELTYRCPLRCPYCSNPVDHARYREELTTDEWRRVLGEAEQLGVVQVHLTGGEPLARRDLESLVERARELDLYVNLITSGVPLARERLVALRAAGLDNLQLSLQDVDEESSDRIAGHPCWAAKLEVARWAKEVGLPLTLNVVLHRHNLDRLERVVALAEELGAARLELANTQYHGWALANRAALLPAEEQLARAHAIAAAAQARWAGRIEVVYVKPDYFSAWPKACMDGWGRRYVHIVPDGTVLPCHAARVIPGLSFERVRDRPLDEIWLHSDGINRFRGEAWMPSPCRDCERRGADFGGCRCQAFQLTGDAAATDPACSLSPDHALIEAARKAARSQPRLFVYRGS